MHSSQNTLHCVVIIHSTNNPLSACSFIDFTIFHRVPDDYILPEGFFTKCGNPQMTAC